MGHGVKEIMLIEEKAVVNMIFSSLMSLLDVSQVCTDILEPPSHMPKVKGLELDTDLKPGWSSSLQGWVGNWLPLSAGDDCTL